MEKLHNLLVRIFTTQCVALYLVATNCFALDGKFDINQSAMSYFQLDPANTASFSLNTSTPSNSRIFVVAQQNSAINQLNLQAGAGYALPVNAQLDLKATMLYQEDNQQNSNQRPIKHLAIEAGTQYKINQAIQLYSAIIYRVPKKPQQADSTKLTDEVGIKLSGEYFFSQSVSAGIHAQIIAENKIYGVQGSFHF
ncbi:hypothetical protein DS2_11423 [Catenovulum agarivorans DS-2]|uniref:Outer membrane protein beta-barrel domain-containing protein n=1 Tax=Catenovulum agarivorans DS-2 TaxID=1328313 RepID=W7QAB2_9ALTE|nr:hypothetical protein [Catenovulum agarivorans]EWH09739.1 hypothetical protein DS2_11423 [Catenovulum agarivorans DS-2]